MVSKSPVFDSNKLERGEVWGRERPRGAWVGAFALYGGYGATAPSTIVYEVEPGKRLGWHTDATEKTQYIIAGTAGSIWKTAQPGRSALEACSFCRRRRATISANTGKEML